jgi:phosphoglycolate phosphatase
LFDLDGTLLDTIEDIAEAVNQVLAHNHFPVHSVADYKQMVGLGLEQLIFDVLPAYARDEATLKRLLADAGDAYAARWRNHTRPFPGVVALLQALKARGLKTAVLSNKPHRFTQQCVDTLLPGGVLDVVMGAQAHLPKKPAPDGALKISEQLGVLPERVLYVGDSGTDMQTAKAAGMFAVGVTWGFRAVEELKAQGADAIIHKPEELLSLL